MCICSQFPKLVNCLPCKKTTAEEGNIPDDLISFSSSFNFSNLIWHQNERKRVKNIECMAESEI